MTTGIDESLNRLQTDWVDIWHLHKEDLVTPLAETVATMGDIIASGKVLSPGGSPTIGPGEWPKLAPLRADGRP